jgi:hypothetical protein
MNTAPLWRHACGRGEKWIAHVAPARAESEIEQGNRAMENGDSVLRFATTSQALATLLSRQAITRLYAGLLDGCITLPLGCLEDSV